MLNNPTHKCIFIPIILQKLLISIEIPAALASLKYSLHNVCFVELNPLIYNSCFDFYFSALTRDLVKSERCHLFSLYCSAISGIANERYEAQTQALATVKIYAQT